MVEPVALRRGPVLIEPDDVAEGRIVRRLDCEFIVPETSRRRRAESPDCRNDATDCLFHVRSPLRTCRVSGWAAGDLPQSCCEAFLVGYRFCKRLLRFESLGNDSLRQEKRAARQIALRRRGRSLDFFCGLRRPRRSLRRAPLFDHAGGTIAIAWHVGGVESGEGSQKLLNFRGELGMRVVPCFLDAELLLRRQMPGKRRIQGTSNAIGHLARGRGSVTNAASKWSVTICIEEFQQILADRGRARSGPRSEQ